MPAINAENASAWQHLANHVDVCAPRAGRRVRVVKGRKLPIGTEGEVLRHTHSRFANDRYASEASLHIRDMMGRHGFVCLVRFDTGATVWINAENLAVWHAPSNAWLTEPPSRDLR